MRAQLRQLGRRCRLRAAAPGAGGQEEQEHEHPRRRREPIPSVLPHAPAPLPSAEPSCGTLGAAAGLDDRLPQASGLLISRLPGAVKAVAAARVTPAPGGQIHRPSAADQHNPTP